MKENGVSAMSAVCRDEHGKYMGSSSLVLEGILDRHSLDVIACREGMALAEDLLVQDVIISCENKWAIKEIKDLGGGIQASIIKEIHSRLSRFNSCFFNSESRSTLLEATLLGQFSVGLSLGRHVWLIHPHDESCIPVMFGQ